MLSSLLVFFAPFFSPLVSGERIRRYNLTLTYDWDKQGLAHRYAQGLASLLLTLYTDGHGRPTFLINGNTPGPVLTVDEGETLEAFVDNQLPIETTIHW